MRLLGGEGTGIYLVLAGGPLIWDVLLILHRSGKVTVSRTICSTQQLLEVTTDSFHRTGLCERECLSVGCLLLHERECVSVRECMRLGDNHSRYIVQ